MTINDARVTANSLLTSQQWAQELAGILPLSTLIDFVDIPQHFHAFQLIGSAPLWSWPITPANSRILLSKDYLEKSCYLDRVGADGTGLSCIDGRYGDKYPLVNGHTVRQCLESCQRIEIPNRHGNMADDMKRLQKLTVVHVTRNWDRSSHPTTRAGRGLARRVAGLHGRWHCLVSSLGWLLWLVTTVSTGLLGSYFATAFLVAVPMTGYITSLIHGGRPRCLLGDQRSEHNRLVVVAPHMNATNWMVFYGESRTVNSLLNRPLEPSQPGRAAITYRCLRLALRVFVMGQWALALAAAALKDWNAYFITFWVVVCIMSQSYLLRPSAAAADWMKNHLRMQLALYETQVSSRHALLNTIIALNPDTFPSDASGMTHNLTQFDSEALAWIDPILKPTETRARWLEATLSALQESFLRGNKTLAADPDLTQGDTSLLSEDWMAEYGRDRGAKFISEGIYVAAKIKEAAGLPGPVLATPFRPPTGTSIGNGAA